MSYDSDSDAPEEFTCEQGIRQDQEIRKIQSEHKIRIAQEGKERRRQWAKRKISNKKTDEKLNEAEVNEKTEVNEKKVNKEEEEEEEEQYEKEQVVPGMLPRDILNLLAAKEKQVFMSDSEEEIIKKEPQTRKKKRMKSGSEPVILKTLPSPQCLQNSKEFLRKRKMQVSRSTLVLKNPKAAFRLATSYGLLPAK